MTRAQVLQEIKPFFSIDELVCDHVLAKWGEQSWQFLDTAFLETLLVIRRDIIARPMWCNSKFRHQRGLRCNLCDLVKTKKVPYLSAHTLGKAGDFDISGMTAEQARQKIKANAYLLPYPIRIEKDVTWLHFDVRPMDGFTGRVYEFSA